MMMTQEQAFLKSREQLQAMQIYLETASAQGERIDKVERELFSQVLLVGLTMLEGFVAQQGDGDVGPTLQQEGRKLQRSEKPHPRRYLSIFGELSISRWVYAQREGQKIEAAPLDAKLSLPGGDFSYVLEDWQQRLCVKESFHEGVTRCEPCWA